MKLQSPANSLNVKNTPAFGYSFFLKDVPAPCAYCGRKMLSISNVNHFADTFASRKGQSAIAVLRTFVHRLDPKYQMVVNQLTSTIEQYPKHPITSILSFLAGKYENVANVNYENAIKIAYKKSGIKERSYLGKNLKGLIEESQKEMFVFPNSTTNHRILRITKLQNEIQQYILRTGSPENAKKLKRFLAIINGQFTTIKQDSRTFFAKFGYDSPRSFMGSLLAPIRATADHIVPVSEKGASDPSNYLAVCGRCNWTRGDKDFATFVHFQPERIPNIKKQLTFLDSLLAPDVKIRKHGNDSLKGQIKDYLWHIQPTIEDQIGYPLTPKLPNLEGDLFKGLSD